MCAMFVGYRGSSQLTRGGSIFRHCEVPLLEADRPAARPSHPPRLCRSEMCCGEEEGSYCRLLDSCITQLKAQGPSRTCNESKEAEVFAGLSGDTTPRRMTGLYLLIADVTMYSHSGHPTRGCISGVVSQRQTFESLSLQVLPPTSSLCSLLLSSLKLNGTKFYEPQIRARLETAANSCEKVVLKVRTVPMPTSPRRAGFGDRKLITEWFGQRWYCATSSVCSCKPVIIYFKCRFFYIQVLF